mmetsp:Transcript_38515/g.93183  ORF Transcript_38515/g.93183 Transcript_38515/m.93183 type:complete len:483 (+) Transcript_38515:101-1549(+)
MDPKTRQKVAEGKSKSVASKGGGGRKVNQALSSTAKNPFGNSFGFGSQDHAAEDDSEWTNFASEKNEFSSNNPFRPNPSSQLTKTEIGDADAQHLPTRKLSPAGVAVAEDTHSETRAVDVVPFEDVPIDDGTSKEKAVNFVPQTVSRIMSEDTQDTNDTAPMSNRDPNRPPVHPSSPNSSNLNLDAFCSKYYNTPAGQQMHSTGALGDFISPIESPIDEDEEEEEGEGAQWAQSSSHEDAKKMLEIPRMGVKLVRTASEASSLLGETLVVEEKKTSDNPSYEGAILLPDGGTAVNTSNRAPERGRTKAFVRPSQNQAHRDTTATLTPASALTTLNDEDSTIPLTPHPFFWRTFPNVTVTTDDIQDQNGSQQQSRIQSSSRGQNNSNRAADLAALAAVRLAVQEHIRQHTAQIVNEEIPPGAECSPFVDQEVIKRLWMESRQQAQRQKQVVQSSVTSIRMPGVFNGSRNNEYQPPENLNFAMG